MDIKQETIKHYKRMIKWAKTQPRRSQKSSEKMRIAISENWYSGDCSYCKAYKSNCSLCKLAVMDKGCCGERWVKMATPKTWGGWITKAEKVLEYIKENG